MSNNIINTIRIKEAFEECDGIKTIIFNMKDLDQTEYIKPKPGQFVMVWVPGEDEIPMSISSCKNNGDWSITVKSVGECSNAIHNLRIGDFIGIRGPLGNYFKIPDKKTKNILISGGVGTAPLKFLAMLLDEKRIAFDLIEATKTETQQIFTKEFSSFKSETSNFSYCVEFTDNSSENYSTIISEKKFKYKGLAHESFESLIKFYLKRGISNFRAFTAGPEKMIYKIFQTCEKYKIELQASLERIMRCGCGLCGLCAVDPLGLLVCKEGPVFDSKILRQLDDFGKYKRDFTGKKVPLD